MFYRRKKIPFTNGEIALIQRRRKEGASWREVIQESSERGYPKRRLESYKSILPVLQLEHPQKNQKNFAIASKPSVQAEKKI